MPLPDWQRHRGLTKDRGGVYGEKGSGSAEVKIPQFDRQFKKRIKTIGIAPESAIPIFYSQKLGFPRDRRKASQNIVVEGTLKPAAEEMIIFLIKWERFM